MYIPSFKLISQSMLKKSPENADGRTGRTGRTDGQTLPRHDTSRFSKGRIKTIQFLIWLNSLVKDIHVVGIFIHNSMLNLFHAKDRSIFFIQRI